MSEDKYKCLRMVLDLAYNQAAYGKGVERHGQDGAGFIDQPMQKISDLLRTPDGMRFQAIKKIDESRGLPEAARRNELLGAIVYIAGIIIYDSKHSNK